MSKFIGIVSAYAYAVSQGYTGTEEEYAELMASYGTVAQEAAESAQTASSKAEEARQSASIASTRATEATTAAGASIDAKNDAVNAQTAAETAQGKAETAQGAAEGAARSVSASAAQIAQNASDITELKSDLNNVVSVNVLDPTALTVGKFMRVNGTPGNSASYAYTDFIKVNEGDIVRLYTRSNSDSVFRYVTAYDSNKTAISASGAENVSSYTVPSGISYVIVTGYTRTDGSGIDADTARITLTGSDCGHVGYKKASVNTFAKDNYTNLQYIANTPLTTLNPYILKTMAYRPLGQLSKPYICLVSDDGLADVATYTIPMLQSKGDIPCTFAVMKSSEVFSTQSGTNALIEAVQNHNCEIAQHGGTAWTLYDEYMLNRFFNIEKAYFDTLGLTPYGAVCPTHAINDIIRAVAGGRFGCVRTGYDNADVVYTNYNNGARSNIYALTSQSSVDSTLASQKEGIDICKANNYLRMIHWHENELTAEKKAQLEGIIDYALAEGITFITMRDIPHIT